MFKLQSWEGKNASCRLIASPAYVLAITVDVLLKLVQRAARKAITVMIERVVGPKRFKISLALNIMNANPENVAKMVST